MKEDSRPSASANFHERAVDVSPVISRILADLHPQADGSAVCTSRQILFLARHNVILSMVMSVRL